MLDTRWLLGFDMMATEPCRQPSLQHGADIVSAIVSWLMSGR